MNYRQTIVFFSQKEEFKNPPKRQPSSAVPTAAAIAPRPFFVLRRCASSERLRASSVHTMVLFALRLAVPVSAKKTTVLVVLIDSDIAQNALRPVFYGLKLLSPYK